MARNKMSDLRDHLFAALEGLADKEQPLDVERAKAICNVSRQIIDSAKVEVKYIEVTGALESQGEFFGKSRQLEGKVEGRPNGKTQ